MNKEYGNRLKTIREKLGLSKKTFGKFLGWSGTCEENYESGKRTIPITIINQLKAIGVDPLYIVGCRKNPFKEKMDQVIEAYNFIKRSVK